MAQSDTIAIVFDEAELKAIQDAVGVLNAKLLPKLLCLSPQDRKELPRMGDKSVAFVQKAFEYGRRHEGLRPAWLDLEAFGIDVQAVETLRDIEHSLTPLVDALSDSLTLSGSEAYQAALVFYSNVKNAAKLKVTGAQGIYDDLSARFPGGSSPSKPAVARS